MRRIPELNAKAGEGQQTLFGTHRCHAFSPPAPWTPSRQTKPTASRAIIEQINTDLKDSALAHLPSGKFTANAAWLVLASIAFNLSRVIGTLAGADLGKARSGTIRRKLITVPARIATSARTIVLHLPTSWPWEFEWSRLFEATCGPPRSAGI
jgi:hypothetical protein